MPKIKMSKNTSYSASEAFEKVKSVLENDAELKKLDSSYSCDFDDKGLCGTAKGKLFKADLDVQDDADGSLVNICVELPFTLALAKPLVEKTLKKKLEKALSQ